MRLLVADKLEMQPLEELRMLGVHIVDRPGLGPEELPAALDGVNILVVRSKRVSAEAIRAGTALNLVVRAGAGVNTIDVGAASARGIYVANCPGQNGAAVAELTMALVLALDRGLCDATALLREGRWDKARFANARGLLGRRFGIAGLGHIGQLVAERARAFGMEVRAWSRSLTPQRASRLGVTRAASLIDLARTSDVLSLHLPLNDQTQRIVDRTVLEALPDGAIFVNAARAGIVDYEALAEATARKGLRVGLDVFDGEPKAPTGAIAAPILRAGVVYGTPHIGASTEQAQHAIATEVCRIVRAFLTEEEVPNVVNVCRTTPARYTLVLRMLDKVGVLANVLNVLKLHGLNVEECHNTVFEGAAATCTKLRLAGRPDAACLAEISAFEEVLHVDVVPLPNLA
jgi:D-3-phosphoglycerate dehydrogenase